MDAIHVDLGSPADDPRVDDVHDDHDSEGSPTEGEVTENIESGLGEAHLEAVASEENARSDSSGDHSVLEDSSEHSSFRHRYYRSSLDPVDVFTGGVFATSTYDSDMSRRSSMESVDSPRGALAVVSRTSSTSSSSSSDLSQSLSDERSGVVMAEHLDTFSGAFNSENYRSASTFVGKRHHDSSPGLIHRVTGYVSGLTTGVGDSDDSRSKSVDSYDEEFRALPAGDVQTHGQPSPANATTAQDRPATASAVAGIAHDAGQISSSSSSVSSSQSAPNDEEFFAPGTNLDNPQLSSHPNINLPPNCNAVGVIGRDFDEPQAVVQQAVHGVEISRPPWSDVYFRPMVIPSKDLNRTDCRQYLNEGKLRMLILCYNTTETRLMLTSPTGGYYKYVLPYAQRLYGVNKVVIVLTRCKTPSEQLVHPALHDRLKSQPLMMEMFKHRLVLSWDEHASEKQQQHLLDLINATPVNADQDCVIL
eukprot:scpid65107/ scgid0753/ 